jgi:hypothetical protein
VAAVGASIFSRRGSVPATSTELRLLRSACFFTSLTLHPTQRVSLALRPSRNPSRLSGEQKTWFRWRPRAFRRREIMSPLYRSLIAASKPPDFPPSKVSPFSENGEILGFNDGDDDSDDLPSFSEILAGSRRARPPTGPRGPVIDFTSEKRRRGRRVKSTQDNSQAARHYIKQRGICRYAVSTGVAGRLSA